nr:DUF6596 domain-containing protein [Microbacterium protaetiae]
MSAADRARSAAERAVRDSYGRLVALLAASIGDLSLAEDCLADALERALRTWPDAGIPHNPEGWLLTVGRNRLRDLLGSAARRTAAPLDETAAAADDVAALLERGEAIPDRRLELLYACAHPAIDPGIRTPLMLQAVLGFDAAQIGRAFDVPTVTMAQRLVRAKRKIRAAGIPFTLPQRDQMPARTTAVLEAIYGAYAISWLDQGDQVRTSTADEARWLAVLTATLLRTDAEAWGLAALLTLAQSRAPARVGDPWPPLAEQNTALWDRELIAEGEALLRRAAALGRPLGRFQLEAAIQSVHCDRARTGALDREALVKLYRGLVTVAPTTGARAALAAASASRRTTAPDARSEVAVAVQSRRQRGRRRQDGEPRHQDDGGDARPIVHQRRYGGAVEYRRARAEPSQPHEGDDQYQHRLAAPRVPHREVPRQERADRDDGHDEGTQGH